LTTFTVGLVAHESRRDLIRYARTQADVVCVDDGTLGCEGNHVRTIRNALYEHRDRFQDSLGWVVIIEDDAILCRDWRVRVNHALCNVPSADVGIVSFYLGTGNPRYWQRGIKSAIREADAKRAPWIVSEHLLHGVGYALRVTDVPEILDHLDGLQLPIDEGITAWARENNVLVAYTWPSLVDHRDAPSVAVHKDGVVRGVRRAHRVGKPKRLSQDSVRLEYI